MINPKGRMCMDEYVKKALEVTRAQAGVRNMAEEEVGSMTASLASKLRELDSPASVPIQDQQPAVDPEKCIREKSVVCLECGKQAKSLTKKHLAQHGLTPQEYKDKWGLKRTQPLVAKSLSRQRRKIMHEKQIWKRSSVIPDGES